MLPVLYKLHVIHDPLNMRVIIIIWTIHVRRVQIQGRNSGDAMNLSILFLYSSVNKPLKILRRLYHKFENTLPSCGRYALTDKINVNTLRKLP